MLKIYYRLNYSNTGGRAWTDDMAAHGQFAILSSEEIKVLRKLAEHGMFQLEMKEDDE